MKPPVPPANGFSPPAPPSNGSPSAEFDFSQVGIDPQSIFFVLSWGFGFVVGAYLLGWVIGLAVDLVKKI